MKKSKSTKGIFLIAIVMFVFSFCFSSSFAAVNKVVALSFDDGPNPISTPKILKILQDNNAKATFFVVGGNVHKYPDLVKEEFANGNEIGNHSYTHPNLSKMPISEIEKEIGKTNDVIYNAIHVKPVLFRPPYGASGANVNQVLANLGMKKMTWDYMVDDYDADKTTSDKIASQVIAHVHSGAVITMHDGFVDREKTVAALPVIISTLKKEGYSFVTISEMRHIKPYQDNQ